MLARGRHHGSGRSGLPRQNRVTPTGAIEAVGARGLLTGNRGVLHDAQGRLGPSRWRHRRWIACRLAFKGRHREVMAPGRWTELFFLDEATAFAAGHRPCAECRRADYLRFVAAWRAAHVDPADADAIDKALHAARVEPRTREQRSWKSTLDAVPAGCFVRLPDRPGVAWLLVGGGDRPRAWSHHGYGEELTDLPPKTAVAVLTPQPLAAVFSAGYAPDLHPSGRRPPSRSAT